MAWPYLYNSKNGIISTLSHTFTLKIIYYTTFNRSWHLMEQTCTQEVHSDHRKRQRIRPKTTIKRLKSFRKRAPFLTVLHRFRAVIRQSILCNVLHRIGKQRRFRQRTVSHIDTVFFAVYCLKTALFKINKMNELN